MRTIIAVLLATVIATLGIHAMSWHIVPVLAGVIVAYCFGLISGETREARRSFEEMRMQPTTIPAVGGPMDGVDIPVPPFALHAGSLGVVVHDHEEGTYRYDPMIDRLVWEEFDEDRA